MLRLIIPLTLLMFIAGFSGTRGAATADSISPDPTPTPGVTVERIEIDKTLIVIPCPFYKAPGICGRDESGEIPRDHFLAKVTTILKNDSSLPALVYYKVSGGRIVGSGTNVYWDLSGMWPGVYKLSATADIGYGESAARTVTVNLKECELCHIPCVCPTLSVTPGPAISPGETATFSAQVVGGTVSEVEYEWTVDGGVITEGQGTATIKVKTASDQMEPVRAEVAIRSATLCENCIRTADATVTVRRPK